MSRMGHHQTHAPQQKTPLFDHLVGGGEQRRWYLKPDCLGGLEVNHQLELDWRLDGKLARFRALENAVDV
jgi:hypothetical protein